MSAAVLFIEMQNEWLHPEGRIRPLMTDSAQFRSAVNNACSLLDGARQREVPVIHAGLGFQPGHPELGQGGAGLRAAIRAFGTFPKDGPGSAFADGFEPREDEFVVQGRVGASAFSGSNLDAYLRNNRISRLYLAGFALHVCVLATAWAGHDLGYEITVVGDATAAFTAEQRRLMLEEVFPHIGRTRDVDGALRELDDDQVFTQVPG